MYTLYSYTYMINGESDDCVVPVFVPVEYWYTITKYNEDMNISLVRKESPKTYRPIYGKKPLIYASAYSKKE